MDTLFRSNPEWPTLQSFSKKDNVARLKFNNEANAKKARQIIKADPQIKASLKYQYKYQLYYIY